MENTPAKRQQIRSMIAALALLLLAACGQSGPLYLPDENSRSAPEQPEPAPPADEDDEDGGR